MNTLEFLREWYKRNCDGDWEHQYGVKITTIDNPGWYVRIHLAKTELEGIDIEWTLSENSDDDWWQFSVKNGEFTGVGDPDKLETILGKFREIAMSQ